MAKLTQSDHERIAEAIRSAEEKTSGEIYAILARRSDDYFFVAGYMIACGILIAGVAAAILSHWMWISTPLPYFGIAVLAAFVMATLVLYCVPAIRLYLVPHRIRYLRAHQNAVQQFLAHNIHRTSERTGILLFVSLAERYAEVVADAGIDERVDQDDWNAIVALLVEHSGKGNLADGFVGAIGKAGVLLSRHFPRRPGDTNELHDHLVEL